MIISNQIRWSNQTHKHKSNTNQTQIKHRSNTPQMIKSMKVLQKKDCNGSDCPRPFSNLSNLILWNLNMEEKLILLWCSCEGVKLNFCVHVSIFNKHCRCFQTLAVVYTVMSKLVWYCPPRTCLTMSWAKLSFRQKCLTGCKTLWQWRGGATLEIGEGVGYYSSTSELLNYN